MTDLWNLLRAAAIIVVVLWVWSALVDEPEGEAARSKVRRLVLRAPPSRGWRRAA